MSMTNRKESSMDSAAQSDAHLRAALVARKEAERAASDALVLARKHEAAAPKVVAAAQAAADRAVEEAAAASGASAASIVQRIKSGVATLHPAEPTTSKHAIAALEAKSRLDAAQAAAALLRSDREAAERALAEAKHATRAAADAIVLARCEVWAGELRAARRVVHETTALLGAAAQALHRSPVGAVGQPRPAPTPVFAVLSEPAVAPEVLGVTHQAGAIAGRRLHAWAEGLLTNPDLRFEDVPDLQQLDRKAA